MPAIARLRPRDVLVDGLQHLAVGAPRAEGRDQYVALPPQHALRHARGSPGIEDVEIVRRPLAARLFLAGCGQGGFVLHGSLEQGRGLVVHLDQEFQRRHLLAHMIHMFGQGTVVQEGPRLRIVQEVDEFLVDVAVVDVERRHPRFVRAEHSLRKLVAVVEVDPQVVLTAAPVVESLALGVAAETAFDEQVRETPGAAGEVRVAEPPVAEHDGLPFRDRVRDGFVDGGQVVVQGSPSPCSNSHFGRAGGEGDLTT